MLRSTRALVVLVLTATLLFAAGSVVERSSDHDELTSSTNAATAGHEEADEHRERAASEASSSEAAGPAEAAEQPAESGEHGQEATLLGIKRESGWLPLAAVLISLGLAGALFVAPGPATLWATLAWGLGFAAADVAELVEQPAAVVAAIAGLLLALHLATAALASPRQLSDRLSS